MGLQSCTAGLRSHTRHRCHSVISGNMPVVRVGRICSLICAVLAAANPLFAQQDPFRWMDFHSEKDQDIVVWVTRALNAEKWTAIREIGVQYDAALVVTTLR